VGSQTIERGVNLIESDDGKPIVSSFFKPRDGLLFVAATGVYEWFKIGGSERGRCRSYRVSTLRHSGCLTLEEISVMLGTSTSVSVTLPDPNSDSLKHQAG